MRNRKLTKGEVKNIWGTLDVKKNNLVEEKQWKAFFQLFLEAFQNCDVDGSQSLNKEELDTCLGEEHLESLGLKGDSVLESVDREQEEGINLADYLFLRRVKMGWEKCANAHQLSKIEIPCAMKVAVPNWVMTEADAHQLFDSIMAIQISQQKYYASYLNLLQYLEYAHIYYYFISFEIPFYNNQVNKQDMLRAIDY